MLRPQRLSSRRCVQSISMVAAGPASERAGGAAEPWLRRLYVRAPEGLLNRSASWDQLELPLTSTAREAFLVSLERQIERIGQAQGERAATG
jgi:hypothetical protein